MIDSAFFDLIFVFLLVLANGFFVAAEFALVKVRSTQLELLATKGSYRAQVALTILENLNGYLSAAQLGITLTSLGLGWVGEPVVASMLERGFLLIGIDSPVWAHRLALPIGFFVITFLHIVVGELAPKSIAIQKSQPTTLAVAIPFRFFYTISYPLVWFLNANSNGLLALLGFRQTLENEVGHSAEELNLLVFESEKSNKLSLVSRDLLLNTLDLRRRLVREIMVPRPQVAYFSLSSTLIENLEIAKRTQHTRFPLCSPNLDNVVGMVHMKDMLWLIKEQGENADIRSISRPVIFVPELAVIEKVLRSLQTRRMQAAMVVDEFGAVAGMVTFENIIEEIVGDIQDEFDSERPLWQAVGENQWLVEGGAPLYELKEPLGLDLQSKDATTIGGFITENLGNLPHEGDRLDFQGFSFIVKQVDKRRVKQLLVCKQEAPPPER